MGEGGTICFRPLCGSLRALLIVSFALAQAGVARAEEHAAPEPPAVAVQDGVAMVSPADMARMLPGGPQLVRVAFADAPQDPVLGAGQTGAAEALLRRLYATGQAAGNHGDLYDNRDRAHSILPIGNFPQLARIAYDPALRKAGLDYGVAAGLIFDAPVIGNSSTALTGGVLWRSLPRFLLTRADGSAGLYQNYVAGQIHLYPEHRDHDPERGDLLPANTPYYLISQGSSGSDQPHLAALAMILAAFRPDTKARLIETGLIAPTMQMVYRRARKNVLSREAYLSGVAHPSVFDADGIDPTRMVALANAIPPDAVPPMVRLRVVEETGDKEERLFDTPVAIARVWRGDAWAREMVVSAEATRDPNGRALEFSWVLLRGDPERTRIEPLGPDGRRARITVEWQEPRLAPSGLRSARVDIGVFAHNGAFDSAPGFVSVQLPGHERRVYTVAADGVQQLAERQRVEGVYVDPLIYPDLP